MRENLATEGVVSMDPGVAPRDEIEIDGGDEAVFEDLKQVIDDEIGAVRAEALVVEAQRDFVGRTGR